MGKEMRHLGRQRLQRPTPMCHLLDVVALPVMDPNVVEAHDEAVGMLDDQLLPLRRQGVAGEQPGEGQG